MKCRHCESDVPAAVNFCDTCGKPVLLENPELKKYRGGIRIGQGLVFLLAIGFGSGAWALHSIHAASLNLKIKEVDACKGDSRYDQAQVEASLAELRRAGERSARSALVLGIGGIVFAGFFVLSLFRPYPALGGAGVLYAGLLVIMALVNSASASHIMFPMILLVGLLYGADAARRRNLAVQESRAKTQPKPVIRREPGPGGPPSSFMP